LHGRFQVHARLPTARGSWPAIWMLPTHQKYGSWPASGEIDIMEHVGHDLGIVHGTVHTEQFNHMKNTQVGKQIRIDVAEWHIYEIEWSEAGIDFLVDGQQYHHFSNTRSGSKAWPFDHHFHLVLNVAVGGSWGGQKGIDKGAFASEAQVLEVAFVKVYSLCSRVHFPKIGWWHPKVVCGEYLAEDRVKYLVEEQRLSQEAARSQVMDEFPLLFRLILKWNPEIICEDQKASDRSKRLMIDSGLDQEVSQQQIMTEFPTFFAGEGPGWQFLWIPDVDRSDSYTSKRAKWVEENYAIHEDVAKSHVFSKFPSLLLWHPTIMCEDSLSIDRVKWLQKHKDMSFNAARQQVRREFPAHFVPVSAIHAFSERHFAE